MNIISKTSNFRENVRFFSSKWRIFYMFGVRPSWPNVRPNLFGLFRPNVRPNRSGSVVHYCTRMNVHRIVKRTQFAKSYLIILFLRFSVTLMNWFWTTKKLDHAPTSLRRQNVLVRPLKQVRKNWSFWSNKSFLKFSKVKSFWQKFLTCYFFCRRRR